MALTPETYLVYSLDELLDSIPEEDFVEELRQKIDQHISFGTNADTMLGIDKFLTLLAEVAEEHLEENEKTPSWSDEERETLSDDDFLKIILQELGKLFDLNPFIENLTAIKASKATHSDTYLSMGS